MKTPRPARPAALVPATALVRLALAAPSATARPHRSPSGPGTPAGPGSLPTVTARAETATLYDDEAGGNADADDPAIWRDPADPERNSVVTTAKEGGLRVYDLDARLVRSVSAPPAPGPDDAPGRFNNVDPVHGARASSGRADYAVTTDRATTGCGSTASTGGAQPAHRCHRPRGTHGVLHRPGTGQRAAHRVRAGRLDP
ncbi:hypothetical protein GCM10009863_29400 [Streptomyces axinellae]|uniref:BPP domain-containing protein n=1 Tax=Streptomyces axinellae TaxID=552788 RepID=A0ABP6CHZ8_9ACTN